MLKKIQISLLTLLLSIGSVAFAGGYEDLKSKDNVTVKYKLKENKEGKKEVYIKFKNKAKSAVNVDTEVSFYMNGILEESSMVNDCLKKSCFNNWFRPVHIIITENISQDKLMSEDLKIEITELSVTKIDECRKTDS